MTPEQIAELEALAAKATPGPWEVEKDPTQEGNHATLVCTSGKFGKMGTWLLVCFHNWKDASMGGRCIAWKEAKTNAALTVALRNNLPAILAALKAQQPDEGVVERVAELQLASFLAGRGSVKSMQYGARSAAHAPSMDDFRSMAIAAMQESRDE